MAKIPGATAQAGGFGELIDHCVELLTYRFGPSQIVVCFCTFKLQL